MSGSLCEWVGTTGGTALSLNPEQLSRCYWFQFMQQRQEQRFTDPLQPASEPVLGQDAIVHTEQISSIYKNIPLTLTSNSVVPLLPLYALWDTDLRTMALVWVALMFGVLAFRIFLLISYRGATSLQRQHPRWSAYLIVSSLASGCLWGAAGGVLSTQSLELFLIIILLLTGLSAAAALAYAAFLPAFYAYILPSYLPLVTMALLAHTHMQVIIAIAIMIHAGAIIVFVRNLNDILAKSLHLRFANLDLVAELTTQKETAERANAAKTRFLASASHDLRQPVHALTLFADALQPEIGSIKGKSLLGNMGRSIDALNQLLGSLLDISKLDAAIVTPNLEHFALRSAFERLHAEYSPQAQTKGLALSVDAGNVLVHSDPALLEAMLRNLISNAIRYTRAGSVQIACSRQAENVRIEVRDTGIGIPREQCQEIFREFYQLANPERDRSQGLGLGLAIVERLASLLQHRIELDSELGQGSCFAIVLPAGDPTAVVESATAPTYFGQRDVDGMRVVVIDDEAAVRAGMLAVLEGWGCETVLASSEGEALESLRERAPPHVIIADYRLRDDKTGAQAIEGLRREFGNDIPALIITGDTDPARLREAQASGHALMHKPVQPGKLRAYLRSVQRRKA